MKKRKKPLSAAIVFGAAAITGVAVAANYFYNVAIKRGQRKITDIEPSSEAAAGPLIEDPDNASIEEPQSEVDAFVENTRNWLDEAAGDVYLISRDKLKLHALKARTDTGKYAIICHGYTGYAASMAPWAYSFNQRGFNVLLPDARGHGESEGDYIGMGWPERLDIIEWIRFILDENAFAKIVLFGVSMGAATVMMTAGEELPENVTLVIEDCGYSSVWDQFSHTLRKIYHLPRFPVMYASSAVSKLRAGYGFKEASAVEQLKKSKLPILFIHGDEDTFVPFEMLDILYEASASEDKEKLVIHGAAHANSMSVDFDRYWEAIDAFLKKHDMT